MKRKLTVMIMIALICAVVLAGCRSGGTTATPTPVATNTPSATVMPSPSMGAELTNDPMASIDPTMNGNEAMNNEAAATAVKAEVDKLSEISMSYVVVVGSQALIGITYDSQYQGGMTERLTTMIDEKAKAADSSIVTVTVTDDEAQVSKIKELEGKNGQDIKQDFSNIVDEVKKPA